MAKTSELLKPHQTGCPITFNHYFTEALQKIRNERDQNTYTTIIKSFYGVSSLNAAYLSQQRDLRILVIALVENREPNMHRFACSEALDCMEAYCKVAYLCSAVFFPYLEDSLANLCF